MRKDFGFKTTKAQSVKDIEEEDKEEEEGDSVSIATSQTMPKPSWIQS